MLGHVFDCAAVVQAVCKLDEHHTNIVVERQQYPLEILGLYAFGGGDRPALAVFIIQHRLDLGKAIHEQGDMVPEEIADIVDGIVRIFHHIVQQSC